MDMDKPTSTSAAAMTGTATGTMAMPASTSKAAMSMGMSNGCKISMLWNWYTVDSCFISSTWKIRSSGMFAGSCIGVILLVISLAALRHIHRRYDAFLVRRLKSRRAVPSSGSTVSIHRSGSSADNVESADGKRPLVERASAITSRTPRGSDRLRPNVTEQAIRSFLYTAEFAVAYFVMLLAMYYNGYIIICILIGAFLGYFMFEWDLGQGGDDGSTEVTGCCG